MKLKYMLDPETNEEEQQASKEDRMKFGFTWQVVDFDKEKKNLNIKLDFEYPSHVSY